MINERFGSLLLLGGFEIERASSKAISRQWLTYIPVMKRSLTHQSNKSSPELSNRWWCQASKQARTEWILWNKHNEFLVIGNCMRHANFERRKHCNTFWDLYMCPTILMSPPLQQVSGWYDCYQLKRLSYIHSLLSCTSTLKWHRGVCFFVCTRGSYIHRGTPAAFLLH